MNLFCRVSLYQSSTSKLIFVKRYYRHALPQGPLAPDYHLPVEFPYLVYLKLNGMVSKRFEPGVFGRRHPRAEVGEGETGESHRKVRIGLAHDTTLFRDRSLRREGRSLLIYPFTGYSRPERAAALCVLYSVNCCFHPLSLYALSWTVDCP